MLVAFRGTMGLHFSAAAMLETSSGVARIDQRLRRIDPDMPDTIIPYREIPLTRGKVALVDVGDYERVAQYKWSTKEDTSTPTEQSGIVSSRKRCTCIGL